jgi:uridylate kinase
LGNTLPYKRVLLKISGEALQSKDFGVSPQSVLDISERIKEIKDLGVELSIVVGGGNIIRGITASEGGIERSTADYMGMLATVINAMALQNAMEGLGVQTRVLSAISLDKLAEPYIRRRALRHLEKGRVIIFAGGTGNPYFSTDTAAVLRAIEIKADILLKATKVDGVYDADPMKEPRATKFDTLSYIDVLKRKLKVMDSTAVSLCMDNDLPIIVFNLWDKGALKSIVTGEATNLGTLIAGEV